jgi:pimeloyl-ACP methyl ester carboxylesterase
VDQRGHGGSQWASTGYARDRFVEDLASFVDALGLSKFVLAGLSMGGWHSLLYTPDHQDRVERIIIVDISPQPSPGWQERAASRPVTPLEFPSLDEAIAWMRQYNPWASDASLRKDAEDKMHQQEDGKWTWKADSSLFNIPLPDQSDTKLWDRYWKAIDSITCPILEVRGAESGLVADETIEHMKQRGKQFTSVDIPDAGHVVTVDKPYEFIEATRSFLGVTA